MRKILVLLVAVSSVSFIMFACGTDTVAYTCTQLKACSETNKVTVSDADYQKCLTDGAASVAKLTEEQKKQNDTIFAACSSKVGCDYGTCVVSETLKLAAAVK